MVNPCHTLVIIREKKVNSTFIKLLLSITLFFYRVYIQVTNLNNSSY